MSSFIKRVSSFFSRRGSIPPYAASYSQCGEDAVLAYFLRSDGISFSDVFYVDIGAYHPVCFSNTLLFYQAGAHGINIDCRPGSMVEFNRLRGRDTNLEIGISDKSDQLTYYMYEGFMAACNTFDPQLVKERSYKPAVEQKIRTCPLDDVLKQYMPSEQQITFLDIDVEGKEYEILKNFDFVTYHPKYILCEMLDRDIQGQKGLWKLLADNSYHEVSHCALTRIFKHE